MGCSSTKDRFIVKQKEVENKIREIQKTKEALSQMDFKQMDKAQENIVKNQKLRKELSEDLKELESILHKQKESKLDSTELENKTKKLEEYKAQAKKLEELEPEDALKIVQKDAEGLQ